MNIKTFLILFLIIFIAIIFQISFFIYSFPLLSLPFIIIIFWNLYEEKDNNTGIWLSFFGGALIDIYSGMPLGLYTILLITFSIIIKKIIKNNVRIPFTKGA